MNIQDILQHDGISRNLAISGVLIVALYLLRFLAIRSVFKSKSIPTEYRRQWIVKIKTFCLFLLIIGLLVVWASELQTFALSIVAFGAAIVIAFKELIMNCSGYFARASSKPFQIGDRIEIEGMRGDVIDLNLFFTKILEIGPGKITNQYTGRSMSIPNSIFLSKTIINESFTTTYTLHVFQVNVKLGPYLVELQEELLEISRSICSGYIKKARWAFEHFGHMQGLEAPSVDPRVYIHYKDKETAEYIVRIPALTASKGRIEQEILSAFTPKYMQALKENS